MKILVAHDGSEQANKALREALNLAEKFGASINIVTVVPDLCLTNVSIDECNVLTEALTSETEASMKMVQDELSSKGVKAEVAIKHGSPAEAILDVADETGANLIVLGSYGKHGAKRFLLGSVSSKVVDHAKCNVLVIK